MGGSGIGSHSYALQGRCNGTHRRWCILLETFPGADSSGPSRDAALIGTAIWFAVSDPIVDPRQDYALAGCFLVGESSGPLPFVEAKSGGNICRSIGCCPGRDSVGGWGIDGGSASLRTKVSLRNILQTCPRVGQHQIILRDIDQMLVGVRPVGNTSSRRVGVVGVFVVAAAIEERVVIQGMAVGRRVHFNSVLQRRGYAGAKKVPHHIVVHLKVAVEIIEVNALAQGIIQIAVVHPVIGDPCLLAAGTEGIGVGGVDHAQVFTELS